MVGGQLVRRRDVDHVGRIREFTADEILAFAALFEKSVAYSSPPRKRSNRSSSANQTHPGASGLSRAQLEAAMRAAR